MNVCVRVLGPLAMSSYQRSELRCEKISYETHTSNGITEIGCRINDSKEICDVIYTVTFKN